jgi:DNA-binding MarR family transcriptional regulator
LPGGRAHGLSVPQFRALGFVHRHAGSSLSEVADHIGLTLPAMSRLIDGLVELQLMRRQSQSADRRRGCRSAKKGEMIP